MLVVMKCQVLKGMPSHWHKILVILPWTVSRLLHWEDVLANLGLITKDPPETSLELNPRMSCARAPWSPQEDPRPAGHFGSGKVTERSLKIDPWYILHLFPTPWHQIRGVEEDSSCFLVINILKCKKICMFFIFFLLCQLFWNTESKVPC